MNRLPTNVAHDAAESSLLAMLMQSLPLGRLQMTNMLERLNRENNCRTRVTTLLANEASLLRLATAVLSEFCDNWETGKPYVTTSTNAFAIGTQRKASGVPRGRR